MADANEERLVAGAMTGTSMDGLDVVLIRIRGKGPAMTAKVVRHAARPLGAIGDHLRSLAAQLPMSAGAIADLARSFGVLHAEAIAALCADETRIDLAAAHGQTIYHAPPLSWQLLDPAPIARALGCPVVTDLRAADLAAGGQGAPITPVADAILFGGVKQRRAIVNLGGFCNVTLLPGALTVRDWEAIEGFDVCACNQILDAIAREVLGAPYDKGGRAAAIGTARREEVESLRDLLGGQRAAGRSLGTGDEASAWIARRTGVLPPNDLAATAVRAVAETVAQCLVDTGAEEIVLAGGGALNDALVSAIRSVCTAPVITGDRVGVPAVAREAAAMGILGALCADGVAITLPGVTGCASPAPVAGRWCLPSGWPARGG